MAARKRRVIGYIRWRNSSLRIDSWASYTFKNTGSFRFPPPGLCQEVWRSSLPNYTYLRSTCFTAAQAKHKIVVLNVEKSTSHLDPKCAKTVGEQNHSCLCNLNVVYIQVLRGHYSIYSLGVGKYFFTETWIDSPRNRARIYKRSIPKNWFRQFM